MFFQDHEKLIFSLEGSDKKYDPLALDRAFRRESNGKFSALIDLWKAADRDEGDISQDGRLKTQLCSDQAEEELARISRLVFDLPLFPDCTDGVALEYMCQYLDWCKKKEMTDTTPQDSTTSALYRPDNGGPIKMNSIGTNSL